MLLEIPRALTRACIVVLSLFVCASVPAAQELSQPHRSQHRHHARICHGRLRHHCVKPPRAAVRPRHRREQGGPNNVFRLPTSGGLGGLGYDPSASAIAWAEGLRGNTQYAWYCERFVENAFNTSGRYASAWVAARAIGLHGGSAPRGTLVFFRADASNSGFGHVGISLGSGRMISALSTVQETSIAGSGYWSALYAGWAPAPSSWPGRNLIPAGPPPNPTPSAGPPAVQLTAPASNKTLGGTVRLSAHATNVTGVAFDAYFATDPGNVATVGWHHLGDGAAGADGMWTLDVDTHAIPSQDNAGWGTVNIAAIGLLGGTPTAARDYHRVAVSNASAPQPQPQPQVYVHHVSGTCRDGACGLWLHTGPGYSAYPRVRLLAEGAEADVVCQATGETVSNGYASSGIWDRLSDGSWASDFYIDTPVVGQFSPPIPQC